MNMPMHTKARIDRVLAKSAFLLLGLMFLSFGGDVKAQAPTAEADAVFVILAAQTGDPTIGIGANENVKMLTDLFRHQSRQKADFIPLTGANFNHNQILSTISQLNVSRRQNGQGVTNATLVLYVACHGATYAANQQHVMQIPGSRALVPRTTYLAALKQKGVRQVVMLTDTCSTKIPGGDPSKGDPVAPGPVRYTGALSQLLLHQTGVFDFGGSRPPLKANDPGELGAYYNTTSSGGGFFTRAFFEASLRADTSRGWQSILDMVDSINASKVIHFSNGSVQTGQHTYAFPVQ